MRIRPEHIIYTDEQIADMRVVAVDDNDPDAPTIAMHQENGQLMAIVRRSSAQQDEKQLRENLDILRIDWLGVLGYDYEELGFSPGNE